MGAALHSRRFQTAIALAKWEAKGKAADSGTSQSMKLTASQFKRVAEASNGFDDYLRDTHGKHEADRAQDASERAANWQLQPSSSKKQKPGKSKLSRKIISDSSEEERSKKSRSKKRTKSDEEDDSFSSDSEDE